MGGRRIVVPQWVQLDRVRTPRQGWQANAACVGEDLDLFFGEKGNNNLDQAKAICRNCPAVYACLAANLDEEHGVFGGCAPEERRAIRRELKARAAA